MCAYYDTKATGDTVAASEWNAFAIDAVSSTSSGHAHSGAAQDGNPNLAPVTIAITSNDTDTYALSVSRNITNAATHVAYIIQDNATDTSKCLIVNQDGTGNIAEFQDATTSVLTIADGGGITNTATNTSTACIINQQSTGNIVDFQDNGTSAFKIADGGAITATNTLGINSVNATNTMSVTNTIYSNDFSATDKIDATNTITGGSLNDGTATYDSGVITGLTTLNVTKITGAGTLSGFTTLYGTDAEFTDTISATNTITGGSLNDGTATYDAGVITGLTTIANVSGIATLTSVDINGGNIDATTIGASTASPATISTLIASSGTLTTIDINGGTADVFTIGASTAAAGTFTLATTNTINCTGTIYGTTVYNGTSANITGTSTIIGYRLIKEEYTGGAFGGSDGAANRTKVLANTSTIGTHIVFQDGLALTDTDGTNDQYDCGTVVTATLTLKTALFNEQRVQILYLQ